MNTRKIASEMFVAAQAASTREHRRRDPKGARAAIFKLAKDLKIPLSATASMRRGLLYNGKNIATKYQTTSNILHDMAHFLLADSTRRKLPEYGLGASPDTTDEASAQKAALKVIPGFEDGDEEAHASILGILMEKQLGLDYGYTLNEHSWYGSTRLSATTLTEFMSGSSLNTGGGVLEILQSLTKRNFVK